MKKILFILLLLLASCTFKQDYFSLSIDDYTISVGYDDAEYLDVAFNFDMKEELMPNEVIKDIDIYLFDSLLGVGEFTNKKSKENGSDKAVLSKITIYLEDLKGREFKLNGESLDSSIKKNCDRYNGTYISKNGYACVIENKVQDELNVVELHGDYLNLDQDKLNHIIIYVE